MNDDSDNTLEPAGDDQDAPEQGVENEPSAESESEAEIISPPDGDSAETTTKDLPDTIELKHGFFTAIENPYFRTLEDNGKPVMAHDPTSTTGKAFMDLAAKLVEAKPLKAADKGSKKKGLFSFRRS